MITKQQLIDLICIQIMHAMTEKGILIDAPVDCAEKILADLVRTGACFLTKEKTYQFENGTYFPSKQEVTTLKEIMEAKDV